ncbi:hypothetical protein [Roseimarinus sediminis]|uniref:hypothetical protein n=1 Tax=Roseimarinus sediminis TaxID=1610899 RepID=UPI003D23DA4F
MKNELGTIGLLLLLLSLTPYANGQSFQGFIESVTSYQDQVKLKKTGQKQARRFIIDSTTFELSTYLGMFDQLTLAPERKAEYVFCSYETYGFPACYVIHDSVNFDEHIEQGLNDFCKRFFKRDTSMVNEAVKKHYREEIRFAFAEDSINKLCNALLPDDSKAGFVQYLYFHLFGENFALFWHSNINQGNVIFSKDEMKRLFNLYMSNEDYFVDIDEYKLLRDLLETNFDAVIKQTNEHYTITWYEQYLHQGIFKRTYLIERHAPFTITKMEDEKIVAPQYGVIY